MDLSWLPVPPETLAIAMLVTSVAATVHGTVGFGFAIVCVPLLTLLDPSLAPTPQLLLLLPGTAWMAWRERSALDLSGLGWVMAGRVPGAALGVLLLLAVRGRMLDALLGVFVLLSVGLMVAGLRVERRPSTELAAGAVSGALSVVSSMGGPALALLYRDERGAMLRSSLAATFFLGLLVAIGARALAGAVGWADLLTAAWLLPAMLLGVWVSRWLHRPAEGRPLRFGVLAVATSAALALLGRALLS